MSAPRVGIIGARRSHQGLGPFVARILTGVGAEVPAFSCTNEASVAEASEQLQKLAGISAKGYADGERMLADESLDAVAILAPPRAHRVWLERALEAGLDVLCEKPFLWGADDDLDRTLEIVDGFERAGLLLMENCQWPATLPAFEQLHPESQGEPLRRFAMRLAPASAGVEMIGDALPHPISVLQALVPSKTVGIEEIHFSTHADDATQLSVGFRYVADEQPVEVMIELSASPGQPREAGLAVNGRWAHRVIRLRDYALFFASGAQVIDVPDPLVTHLETFVEALRADRPRVSAAENIRIRQRMSALDTLRRAFTRENT